MEDDDDLYGETANVQAVDVQRPGKQDQMMAEPERDESDSDIDIITEKDEVPDKSRPIRSLPTPAPQNSNQAPLPKPSLGSTVTTTSTDPPTIPSKTGATENGRLGSSYPAVHMSNVNVDEKPILASNGKSIYEVDMDNDFGEDEQPWRRPGSDMTDYFNYGFDEFTWADYCLKQRNVRQDVAKTKKQLDDMQAFMKSGMPALPPPKGAGPPVPGVGEIPPEMQKMFTQMMSSGVDPAQMDPTAMMQMMSGGPKESSSTFPDRDQPYPQGPKAPPGRNYDGRDRGRNRRW